MTELSSHKVTRCTPGNSIHVFVSQKLAHLLSSNSQTLVSLTSYKESTTRTSLSHILNFIVSQTKVHLEVHLLSDESASIVSQTIVHRLTVSQTIVHRLTNESASRSSSSHSRKCIYRLTNESRTQTHRLTNGSASSSSHKRK